MLKLKLQYFGHLMRRVDSLEKTLMLGGIGGRRRRGQQRMRWLDGKVSRGPWGDTGYGHPNLSLCLCLSVSWNLTKGKKRPSEFPFRKFSCSLRLSLWEVAWACGFKASMAASHICHFLSCPKRLEGTFRSVHFFTEAFVLFFPSPSHCLSWKMLQMLGKVGTGKDLQTMTAHFRGIPARNQRDH